MFANFVNKGLCFLFNWKRLRYLQYNSLNSGFYSFTLGYWLCCQGCEAGVQDFEGESERV